MPYAYVKIKKMVADFSANYKGINNKLSYFINPFKNLKIILCMIIEY